MHLPFRLYALVSDMFYIRRTWLANGGLKRGILHPCEALFTVRVLEDLKNTRLTTPSFCFNLIPHLPGTILPFLSRFNIPWCSAHFRLVWQIGLRSHHPLSPDQCRDWFVWLDTFRHRPYYSREPVLCAPLVRPSGRLWLFAVLRVGD